MAGPDLMEEKKLPVELELGLLVLGMELLRSAIEKVDFFGGADLRGAFWDELP